MPDIERLLPVYRAMLTARLIDEEEQALLQRGQAFFHVSGAGHEATASLAPHLTENDWLHCHYRDKALLLLRGVPISSFFSGLLCKADSCSAGRQMSAHSSDPARNVLSMVGPVGNNALQAVGVAAAVRNHPGQPVVLCSVGDGTTQQGEFLEACAEAVRHCLPVLFLIEDNGWAISTATTGKTFYSRPDGDARDFYGLPIVRVDGSDAVASYSVFADVVARMRDNRQPALVLFSVERLSDHTNADDQQRYRPRADIEQARANADPVQRLERQLLEAGIPTGCLRKMKEQVAAKIRLAAELAQCGREPEPVLTAKAPLPAGFSAPDREFRGRGTPTLTMREALRDVLRWHLRNDPRVFLYGEDIEDPKGDVFGVTRGLSEAFPDRVVNSPLSESTIVGTCIGRALAGQRPIAFLQFADFLPLAFNQIACELGSMYWRTAGGYGCPVVIMAACGAYKPGLGPFHAQTFESVAAHVPGVDVVMPATAADAAGLLNAALASPRPTLFLYPKAILNLAGTATSADVAAHFVPPGVARRIRAGRDLTLVTWGSTVVLGEKVAAALDEMGIGTDLLDLRSLSPWDATAVVVSAETTGRLLVVHEDNITCGFGAEVVAAVTERAERPVRARRVARPDVYVPCHFGNQLALLPSFRSTLEAAAALLDLDLHWTEPLARMAENRVIVSALGSGPSDETVRILGYRARPGDQVQVGSPLVEIEASKSTFEIASPVAGTVEVVHVREGNAVALGTPLLTIRTATAVIPRLVTAEPAVEHRLSRRKISRPQVVVRSEGKFALRPVGLGAIAGVTGGRLVSNDELLAYHPGRTVDDVLRRTGIESRFWLGPKETVLTLATAAARQALDRSGWMPGDLDLLVCSTGSSPAVTPSLACLVLNELGGHPDAAAYDVNAACSGYLYALRVAHDFLQSQPEGRVLVVTAEALSTRLDVTHFDTAFLFGDAATATVVAGQGNLPRSPRLCRPELRSKPESGAALSVPLPDGGKHLTMHGMTVYTEALRGMAERVARAAEAAGIAVAQLTALIPHQANQRLLDGLERQTGRPVFSNMRRLGNTSSSSIPLALRDYLATRPAPGTVGLCAFGGGFTSAGAVLTWEALA